MSNHKFPNGTKVVIKHQPEQGVCVVTNECEKTNLVSVGDGPNNPGTAIGHYVVIDALAKKGRKDMRYHESSLEVADV